jgi:hypothetical protein
MQENPRAKEVFRHWAPLIKQAWKESWNSFGLYKGKFLLAWIASTVIAGLVQWKYWGAQLMLDALHVLISTLIGGAAVFLVFFSYNLFVAGYSSNLQSQSGVVTSNPPEAPKPNLVVGALLFRTLEENNGRWTGNRHLDRISYRAQLLPIMNAPIPGKAVEDAMDLSAQVIVLVNGEEQCWGSPAPWEDEALNKVTIPLGRSKNIVLTVREGTSPIQGGFWELVSDRRDGSDSPTRPTLATIPYQYEGKLWVRLLAGGKILQTERFTWQRNIETGDFDIRPA